MGSTTVSKGRGWGVALGLMGILIFSQTLPMSKLALASFSPYFVSFGRAFVAGCAAAILLLIRRESRPARNELFPLLIVGLCVAIGFGFFTSLALGLAPASHGAVVIGLVPLLTSLFSSRGRKRPAAFWLWALAGSSVVVLFALWKSRFEINRADLLFVTASVVVA